MANKEPTRIDLARQTLGDRAAKAKRTLDVFEAAVMFDGPGVEEALAKGVRIPGVTLEELIDYIERGLPK